MLYYTTLKNQGETNPSQFQYKESPLEFFHLHPAFPIRVSYTIFKNVVGGNFQIPSHKLGSTLGMTLFYTDGGGDVYVMGDGVHDFSINKQSKKNLLNDPFKFTQKAEFMLYWPTTDPSLAVTDVDLAEHLPQDMLATFGPARVVYSGEEIVSAIRKFRG